MDEQYCLSISGDWAEKEYPLAGGLTNKLVLGATHFVEPHKTYERNSFIHPKVVITSDGAGLSPVSFHDYPEHETPSKQYNGRITYFGGNCWPSKVIP